MKKKKKLKMLLYVDPNPINPMEKFSKFVDELHEYLKKNHPKFYSDYEKNKIK